MDDKQIFENRKHKHLTLTVALSRKNFKEKTFKEIGQRLGKDQARYQRKYGVILPAYCQKFWKAKEHLHETSNLFYPRPM